MDFYLLGHELLSTRLFSPDLSLSHFLYVMRHCDKSKSIFFNAGSSFG